MKPGKTGKKLQSESPPQEGGSKTGAVQTGGWSSPLGGPAAVTTSGAAGEHRALRGRNCRTRQQGSSITGDAFSPFCLPQVTPPRSRANPERGTCGVNTARCGFLCHGHSPVGPASFHLIHFVFGWSHCHSRQMVTRAIQLASESPNCKSILSCSVLALRSSRVPQSLLAEYEDRSEVRPTRG